VAAKFVVKKGPTGRFRFSLLGNNGRVIASSDAYNSKAACMNGIKAVKAVAGGADIEDQSTRAWADEQARLKAATKAAAQAAKKTIKQAGAKKTAARSTKTR
jgi:uncharacterized protein YegP (UPF0339 family)